MFILSIFALADSSLSSDEVLCYEIGKFVEYKTLKHHSVGA